MGAELGPRPVLVEICQVCRLLWSDHVDRTRRRYYASAVKPEGGPEEPTLLDCVELLKLDRRGPAGPPGRVVHAGSVTLG